MYFLNPSNKWNSSNRLSFETPWSAALTPEQQPENMRVKKSVKFEDFCRVILIPKRDEYAKAGIRLWWSPSEFNAFKQERTTELQAAPVRQHQDGIDLKGSTVSCYDIAIRVLVITNESQTKSHILKGLSQFLWSEENENRFGTNIVVNYISFRKVEGILAEDPSYYNVVVIDSPPSNSFQMFKRFRDISPVAVIVCISASKDFLEAQDGASEAFADFVLARPELPRRVHWRDLISLLVDRLESDDFLPSPLIQHYMSTL